jgi:hypothetical protein
MPPDLFIVLANEHERPQFFSAWRLHLHERLGTGDLSAHIVISLTPALAEQPHNELLPLPPAHVVNIHMTIVPHLASLAP